jgi:hypothetical protein
MEKEGGNLNPNCTGDLHSFTISDYNHLVGATCQCSMLEICSTAGQWRDGIRRYSQINVYIQPGVKR